jgi:uncharacterized protein (DUF433 family)
MTSSNEYVFTTPQGGMRIVGTRVSLDSVVHSYLQGNAPETIVDQFPALSLEQVNGAIAFYLTHRQEVDEYFVRQEELWERLRRESNQDADPVVKRLKALRAEQLRKQS